EPQPRQGVAGERVEEEPTDGDGQGHDDGVHEPDRETGSGEDALHARRRDGIGYRGERVRRRVRLRLEGVRELDDKRVDEHERKEGQYAVPEDLGGDALGTTTVATCRPPDAGRRVAATGDRIPRLCHEDAHRAPPEGTARRKARAMRERDRGSSRSR